VGKWVTLSHITNYHNDQNVPSSGFTFLGAMAKRLEDGSAVVRLLFETDRAFTLSDYNAPSGPNLFMTFLAAGDCEVSFTITPDVMLQVSHLVFKFYAQELDEQGRDYFNSGTLFVNEETWEGFLSGRSEPW